MCFRCFQKLLFQGRENCDISPKELSLPSAFPEDTGRADVSELGEGVVTSVCGGKAPGRGADERGI